MNMLPLPKKPFVGDVKKWIDTGSYALNALLSGSIFKGFPANKIVGYIGLESTGKCARGSQSIEIYFETKEDLEDFLQE
jgi:hypothetical protein